MSGNLFARAILGPGSATAFSDTALLQAMLRFEASLARAQGRLGIIPQVAADTIAAHTQTLRLDEHYKLRVVDGIVSGLHSPGESHFELLSAFAPRERLVRAIELAASAGLSSHELGDVCLVLSPPGRAS